MLLALSTGVDEATSRDGEGGVGLDIDTIIIEGPPTYGVIR